MSNSIVLDLPKPPSVNRTRRMNWAASRDIARWKADADQLVLSQRVRRPTHPVPRYELHLTFDDSGKLDLDNGLKQVIDYLRRIEITENDARNNLRRIVAEWGDVPAGCRVEVMPI